MRWIMIKFGLGWLGRQIREMAEGKQGPTLQRLYLAAAGKKTLAGLVLSLLATALAAAGQEGPAMWITGIVGPLLLSAGLIDKSWRADPYDVMGQYPLYHTLRGWSPNIGALMAAGAAWASTCSAQTTGILMRVHLTCHEASVALGVLSALLMQIGLMAEARLATPPRA